jgi:hypothetical protein
MGRDTSLVIWNRGDRFPYGNDVHTARAYRRSGRVSVAEPATAATLTIVYV